MHQTATCKTKVSVLRLLVVSLLLFPRRNYLNIFLVPQSIIHWTLCLFWVLFLKKYNRKSVIDIYSLSGSTTKKKQLKSNKRRTINKLVLNTRLVYFFSFLPFSCVSQERRQGRCNVFNSNEIVCYLQTNQSPRSRMR